MKYYTLFVYICILCKGVQARGGVFSDPVVSCKLTVELIFLYELHNFFSLNIESVISIFSKRNGNSCLKQT